MIIQIVYFISLMAMKSILSYVFLFIHVHETMGPPSYIYVDGKLYQCHLLSYILTSKIMFQ